ncbi:MAG: 3'(2'),5'-bisphosphate nucleotidase CysQ [Gammaproteobacteria bacterium]|nr:3'(2'),5'-bisphosphate nucleotidase CysQ [Gammaproteobacteria bacterium]
MKQLLAEVLDIAVQAGGQILKVYENEFDVDYKDDGSPLTVADKRAHRLICKELEKVSFPAPVISEESDVAGYNERKGWDAFWMVDPLDGTREFVKRNGEFTVNIALVEKGVPILGVVHTPVAGTSHYAARGVGAFVTGGGNGTRAIRVRKLSGNSPILVVSRSHPGPAVREYRKNLENKHGAVHILSMGSSLKICLVAEGKADIYPRLGATSEWDTAAAQCVLEVAGGTVTDLAGRPLVYNKENVLNPWFLAGGDQAVDWTRFLGTTAQNR